MSGSILCGDLIQYYYHKGLLKSEEQFLKQLESLNAEYDALLENLQKDPNLITRLAPATLGKEPKQTDAAYPKATPEQLETARKALTDRDEKISVEPIIPYWLERCAEPRRRTALFIAGAFLILLAFVCFATNKKKTTRNLNCGEIIP